MRCSAVVVMLALFFFGSPVLAQPVLQPGCECYETEPPPAGDSTIEIPALPLGFFGIVAANPSDAFGPLVIDVEGLKLPDPVIAPHCSDAAIFETEWVDRHGTPVAPDDRHRVSSSLVFTGFEPIDTIVCRPIPTDIPLVASAPVAIEIVELSLVSVAPITVTYGGGADTRFWNVFVTESGAAPAGSMTITRTGNLPGAVTGEMTLDSLPVEYNLSFVETTTTIPSPPVIPGDLVFNNPSKGTWTFLLPGPAVALSGRWSIAAMALVLAGYGAYMLLRRRVGK